jgi:molybdopterin/thiamine biosynthesis adenylyltransferase
MTAFKPAMRDSVLVLEGEANELHFVMTSSSTSKTFAVDDMTRRLIPLLDGTRTLRELESEVSDAESFAPEHLIDVLDVLDTEALLAIPTRSSAPALTPDERARYTRQLGLLEELSRDDGQGATGEELQARLRAATVAVIGVGGLGTWLLSSLAAAGVGRLIVCDCDHVELSNLNRQILFGAADVGARKTESAAARLSAVNPTLTVEQREVVLRSPQDVSALAEAADLVINCADRPSVAETSEWVAAACLPRGVPHIVGGAYAYHVGSLGFTVLPGRTACWRCAGDTVGVRRDGVLRGRQGPGPSLAMFSAVVANVLAWDAVRVLLGLRPATSGRLGEIDFRSFDIRWRDIPRRRDCPACSDDLRIDQ